MAKVTAWSWSRLAAYELCPLQFKEKFVTKSIKDVDSPAMARGHQIHDGVAKWLTGKTDGLPRDAFQNPRAEQILKELQSFPDKVVEQQWGYTSNWEPTGWFGADTWFRSVLDVGLVYEDNTGEAIDWKTGKRYGSSREQMETQAIAMFSRYRQLTNVTVRLVYLDEKGNNIEEIEEIKKHEVTSLKNKFEKRVARLFTDEDFPPRPNSKCGFCPISRSKGGKCAFG